MKFVEKADPSSIVNNAEELSTPLRDSQHQDDHENNLGAIISGALNSYHIKGVNLTHKRTSCIDCFSAIVMESTIIIIVLHTQSNISSWNIGNTSSNYSVP